MAKMANCTPTQRGRQQRHIWKQAYASDASTTLEMVSSQISMIPYQPMNVP
eukprot:CAMPEP_0176005912 /NCGR_PEP_ID=MMETSP0120_2-20121206/2450_1 /TAXON_ID=160619 /ORGANISM="Kryptoperidinium foliaceum, Strain CCMP 1326" /LENGTH=50 /DNA_ID=CAMNT_0017338633 /DNA_START=200 /DNA_END=352 /DNA_ORIENTATION=-